MRAEEKWKNSEREKMEGTRKKESENNEKRFVEKKQIWQHLDKENKKKNIRIRETTKKLSKR